MKAILSLFLAFSTSLYSAPTEFEKRALDYFLKEQNPNTGFVRDRARNFEASPMLYDFSSFAATGFGLTIIVNAYQRGLVAKDTAYNYAEKVLRSVLKLEHYKGWFYHFVDWETGERFGKSEISTIDTAWFMAGALYAAAVFPGSEVHRLANLLYERLDFPDMMNDGGQHPHERTLSMGWTPEKGYLPYRWSTYAEQLLLVVLGLGHPSNPLPPDAANAWTKMRATTPAGTLIGPELPLFAHQYSLLYIDLRGKRDKDGDDFHENTRIATIRDREFCKNGDYLTYKAGFWGLSASDAPDGYDAFSPLFHSGTVCPSCALASAAFLPEIVEDGKKWITDPYGKQLWGKYGFSDAINVDRRWMSPDVLGITVGALYLSFANIDGETVWKTFSEVPAIRRGLLRF